MKCYFRIKLDILAYGLAPACKAVCSMLNSTATYLGLAFQSFSLILISYSLCLFGVE